MSDDKMQWATSSVSVFNACCEALEVLPVEYAQMVILQLAAKFEVPNPAALHAIGRSVADPPENISNESQHREGLHANTPMLGCRLCREQCR